MKKSGKMRCIVLWLTFLAALLFSIVGAMAQELCDVYCPKHYSDKACLRCCDQQCEDWYDLQACYKACPKIV